MSTAAPAGAPPIVEFRRATVRFGSFTALHEVSFTVPDVPDRGEFITIIGPSGCGKSTLLNLISGFATPTEGDVLVRGRPVQRPGRDRGMIFQQYSSLPHLTVRENVLFGLRLNSREMGLDGCALLVGKLGDDAGDEAERRRALDYILTGRILVEKPTVRQ